MSSSRIETTKVDLVSSDENRYLASLPDGSHWLCPRGDAPTANQANTISIDRKLNAVVQCLELFTDPDDNASLERFKLSISKSFDCQYCVRNWHISKKTIRKKYERCVATVLIYSSSTCQMGFPNNFRTAITTPSYFNTSLTT